MAIPRFDEDLAIISKLGDNPGSDNNLTTDAFRAKFDEGPQKIQKFLNNVLIPAAEQSSSPMELLWENASPESEFGRQSLPIDTAGYTFLDVGFRVSNDNGIMFFCRAAVGVNTNCLADNYGGKIITRLFDLRGSNVWFDAAFFYNTYGSYAENNGYMIPVRIYGIKGGST